MRPRITWVVRLAFVLLAGLAAWATLVAPGRVEVVEQDLPLAGWPAGGAPLRVALLSDLHVGAPHMDLAKVRDVVARTNAAAPHLVALLGDYVIHGVVGGEFVEPEQTARILAGLRAPLGVWAVLGNHDWWYDGERVRRALQSESIQVLEDKCVRVPQGPGALWLCGLADLWTREPSVGRTLAGVTDGAPVLLLSHNPDVFPDVPARVTMTFAGHTHGGQVRLPLVGAPIVPSHYGQRYAQGLIVEDGRTLFVTPGLGTSIFPVRFRVPPQVSIVSLRAARVGP